MNTQDLLFELNYEYECNLRLSALYFNKWVDTWEENYKERELLHLGAAHQALRTKDKIIPNLKA